MSKWRSMSNRVLIIIAGALLGLAAGWDKVPSAHAQPGGGGAAPSAVTVGQVEVRDVPVQLRPIASVEAFATVTVRSRVSGQLQKIHVTPGQDIKVGDLLFEIDPRPFEIALREVEAQLD